MGIYYEGMGGKAAAEMSEGQQHGQRRVQEVELVEVA